MKILAGEKMNDECERKADKIDIESQIRRKIALFSENILSLCIHPTPTCCYLFIAYEEGEE